MKKGGRVEELTFDFDHVLDEALLVVAFGDHVHENVVLFPEAVDLVVLVLYHGPPAVPGHCLLHVSLLGDILRICIREGRS